MSNEWFARPVLFVDLYPQQSQVLRLDSTAKPDNRVLPLRTLLDSQHVIPAYP